MYKPMLASIGDTSILKNKDFIFEPKLDGYRALCIKDKQGIRFISRNNKNITSRFPELKISDNIKTDSAVLDGEIVIYNDKGIPDFQLMQNRVANPFKIDYPASYIIFDILEKDGKSLVNLSLIERKRILKETIKENQFIQVNLFTEKGEKLWNEVKKRELEGVMAKKKNSIYQQLRSKDWIKIKLTKTLDAVIIGYTSEKRNISSLALGLFLDKKIIYIGKVGTGFSSEVLEDLSERFIRLKSNKPIAETQQKDIIWIKPKLVAEIKFQEFTKDKILRAPVFMRLRVDKNPQDCSFDSLN